MTIDTTKEESPGERKLNPLSIEPIMTRKIYTRETKKERVDWVWSLI